MTTTPAIISVYDKSGAYLDTLQARCPRSWLYNDIGQAVFTISLTDPKCTEQNLRVGNYVLIQSEGYATSWFGVIDLPFKHNYGSKTITAYSAEYTLKMNSIPASITLTGTAFGIIKQLMATYRPDMRLFGFESGPVFTYTFKRQTVWDAIKTIVKDSGGRFFVNYDQQENNKNVLPYAQYYSGSIAKNPTIIFDEFNTELVETAGVEDQGPFYTKVYGYGNDTNWSPANDVVLFDQAMIDRYGLRTKNYQVESADLATIRTMTTNYWNTVNRPTRIVQLSVMNINNIWAQMFVGTAYRVKYSWVKWAGDPVGMETWVIVTGLSVDEMTGVMVVSIQELGGEP